MPLWYLPYDDAQSMHMQTGTQRNTSEAVALEAFWNEMGLIVPEDSEVAPGLNRPLLLLEEGETYPTRGLWPTSVDILKERGEI